MTTVTAFVDTFGNLCDLVSGEALRLATAAEAEASAVAADADGGVGAIEAIVHGPVDFGTWWSGVFGCRSPRGVVLDFELDTTDGLLGWIHASEAEALRFGANVNCEGAAARALAEITEALPSTCVARWLAKRGLPDLAAAVSEYETVEDILIDHFEGDDATWVGRALDAVRP